MVVLIVDDELTTRQGMERVLRQDGHVVESTDDGAKALECMRRSLPDVLITDLVMPGISGMDLIATTRALYPYLPVIVVTAQDDVQSAVAAMRLGADDYLTKPVDFDTTVLAIERSVERQRVVRERDHLRHQSEFSRAMVRTVTDPQALGDAAVDEITRMLGDGCVLHMISKDGRHLERVASRATPPVKSLVSQLSARRIDATEIGGMLGPSSMPGDWAPWHGDASVDARPSHLISAPLRSADELYGIVSVARPPSARPFGEHDVALLGDLADRVALAMANAQLFRDLQHELEQRQQAEESLRRTQEQFLHAQKMEAVGRLAGGIAHDFNNVLSVMLSYAGILRDDMPVEDARRKDVDEILGAGRRASTLVQQLLAFSRRQVLAPAVVNLNDVVRSVSPMLRVALDETILLGISLAEDLPSTKVDPGQVEQILMNLLVNARDAVGDHGSIEIRTLVLGVDRAAPEPLLWTTPHVALVVEDDGQGMDANTRERIFEPFFTTKPAGQGTGLGLSTVLGIVEQSGGFIRLESESGNGTTFMVCFPVCESTARAQRPPSIRPPRGSETVLLVDDEENVRIVAETILRRQGYQVLGASSASDAIRLAEDPSLRIDILVTDMVMPHMSGPELAASIRRLRPGLRVLFTSGYPGDAPSHLGEAADFLSKPITPNALSRKVREVLDRS